MNHLEFTNNEKFENEITKLITKYPEYEKELENCIPFILENYKAPKLVLSENIKEEELKNNVTKIYNSIFNIKD